MTPLAPLITSFLRDYMPRQRGYSPQTCETYAVSFKLLLEYAATRTRTRPSRLSIEQLDAPLVVDFLAHIERDRGNGAATRNLRLAAIRSFMRYVEHHLPSALAQVGQIEAIPVKRHEQKLIRHLTVEGMRAILNAVNRLANLTPDRRPILTLLFDESGR
jgi:integrase/recombinase XerD